MIVDIFFTFLNTACLLGLAIYAYFFYAAPLIKRKIAADALLCEQQRITQETLIHQEQQERAAEQKEHHDFLAALAKTELWAAYDKEKNLNCRLLQAALEKRVAQKSVSVTELALQQKQEMRAWQEAFIQAEQSLLAFWSSKKEGQTYTKKIISRLEAL